jgi:putative DNA-invertase from lambdoid prophage Rac
MSHVAYYRVSTLDQSIQAQRHALTQAGALKLSKEFSDEGVSGAIPAAQRPGFAALLAYIREGDTLHVYAVDRLGRDALDVQATVRALLDRGVAVEVHGLGTIAKGVGELILAVLAQVADMERQRIRERTAAGRDKARASLAESGRTHRGKASMGRPLGAVSAERTVDPVKVAQWRWEHRASIKATAEHWKLSEASVKRYCRAAA